MRSCARWGELAVDVLVVLAVAFGVGIAACEREAPATAAPTAGAAGAGGAAAGDDLAVPERLTSARDAVAGLTSACAEGGGLACNELGKHYLARPGAVRTAAESFTKACKAGSQEGCNNQAVMELRTKPRSKPMLQEVTDRLSAACDADEPTACANLAWLLHDSMLGADARALEAATKGCKAGNGRGCVLSVLLAGVAPAAKGAPARPAREALHELCVAEHGEACRLVGEPLPEGAIADLELGAVQNPFACVLEGWLAKMAERMKLTGFTRDAAAPVDAPDCDLWAIR